MFYFLGTALFPRNFCRLNFQNKNGKKEFYPTLSQIKKNNILNNTGIISPIFSHLAVMVFRLVINPDCNQPFFPPHTHPKPKVYKQPLLPAHKPKKFTYTNHSQKSPKTPQNVTKLQLPFITTTYTYTKKTPK
jgi:hypothetical protein